MNEIMKAGPSNPEKSTLAPVSVLHIHNQNNTMGDEKLHHLIRRSPALTSKSNARNANPVENNFRFTNSIRGRYRYTKGHPFQPSGN